MTTKKYESYIKSSEWKKKRAEYLNSDLPNHCYGCRKSYDVGFHFHHLTYERLGKELLSDIVPMCGRCHDEVHSYQRSVKCSIREATDWLRRTYTAKKTASPNHASVTRLDPVTPAKPKGRSKHPNYTFAEWAEYKEQKKTQRREEKVQLRAKLRANRKIEDQQKLDILIQKIACVKASIVNKK